MPKRKGLSHAQMNTQNWRYKKKTPPVDEFASKNGPVKIIVPKIPADLPQNLGVALHRDNVVDYAVQKYIGGMPNAFKCSKCDYVAPGRKESKEHWFDEHQ